MLYNNITFMNKIFVECSTNKNKRFCIVNTVNNENVCL